MSNLSQFGGGSSVPLGGYAAFNPNQGNVITQTDGTVFLKGGVIAPAATYPNVPTTSTDYLNPLVPVANIGTGGRWSSISINPNTGYPLVLSDSPRAPLAEIRGLSTTSSADCITSDVGIALGGGALPKYAHKCNKILHHKNFVTCTIDSSMATGSSSVGYTYSYAYNLFVNGLSTNYTYGVNLNAIASNPTGNQVLFTVTSSSSHYYQSNAGGSVTTMYLPATGLWNCAVYSSTLSLFVALMSGSTIAASSPDGVTWTTRTLPASATWSAVATSGALFIAVASGGTQAAISSNGTTWTSSTLPASATWSAVCYSSTLSMWCAIASGSNIAATSTNGGTTWIQRTLPVSASWADVKWSPALGAFIAVSSDGSAGTGCAISTDGITWVSKVMPHVAPFQQIIAGPGTTLYAVCYSNSNSISSSYYSTTYPLIAKSTDSGLTWTYVRSNIQLGYPSNSSSSFAPDTGFKYLNGYLMCAWYNGSNITVAYSNDGAGATWTTATATTSGGTGNPLNLLFDGSWWYLFTDQTSSASTNKYWYSNGPANWYEATLSISAAWRDAVAIGSRKIVIANGGQVSWTDGINNGWTDLTNVGAYIASVAYYSITYDSVRDIVFVQGNTNTGVSTSYDRGLTWTFLPYDYTTTQYNYPTMFNAGNGKYTTVGLSYIYNSTSNTAPKFISYTHGYNLISNRTGYYATRATNWINPEPVLQGGVNYFSDGNALLKIDTQKYIDNTQSAGERSGYTSSTVLSYYMRVK